MKRYEIEQEALCHFCKEREISAGARLCEGSYCEEARLRYFEDNEIEEVSECFADLEIGASIFVITGTDLLEQELAVKIIAKGTINLSVEGVEQSYTLEPKESFGRLDCSDIYVFINKHDAVKKYKEIMSQQVVKMAETLAKYTNG